MVSQKASSSNEIFPSIDLETLKGELRLETRGLKNGRANLPDHDATDLDQVEREIVQTVKHIRQESLKETAGRERIYRERITGADRQGLRIGQIANDAEINFRKEVSRRHSQLEVAIDDRNESEADLLQFREDNRLHRTVYETGGLLKWVALVIAIIIAESLMNGVFFAESHDLAVLGGIMTAFGISLLNVGVASIAGHAFRQKNHVVFLQQCAGWLALFFGILIALFINFLVGHFRDLTEKVGWNTAAGEAFERVVTLNLQMQDHEAWLLTGIGLLIAIVSIWKAYVAFDPYPGYSRVSNRFLIKRNELQDLRDETLEVLSQTREEATNSLNEEHKFIHASFGQAQIAYEELKALVGWRRHAFLQECEQGVGYLLSVYRDANRKVRTAPEPGYWGQEFHLPPELEPHEPPALPTEAVRQADGIVKAALERIHKMCQEAIGSIETIGSTDEDRRVRV